MWTLWFATSKFISSVAVFTVYAPYVDVANVVNDSTTYSVSKYGNVLLFVFKWHFLVNETPRPSISMCCIVTFSVMRTWQPLVVPILRVIKDVKKDAEFSVCIVVMLIQNMLHITKYDTYFAVAFTLRDCSRRKLDKCIMGCFCCRHEWMVSFKLFVRGVIVFFSVTKKLIFSANQQIWRTRSGLFPSLSI